ncbi:MAG TPA: amino acid permease [bacterium]|nr:amino acid permease [bacterium]
MSAKFGTFKGVFVPSTEAILGTVLFLLMPVLIADVGLWAMLGIIILAHTVTFSTAFSMSDCATNLNNVGPGGMYALSRRSLGKALGGSIGFQLYLAQAASIGFYSIGFAEPLQALLAPVLDFIPLFTETDPASILMQKQILASVFFFVFFIVVMVGADFTLKIQTLILFVLGISILAIMVSPFFGITYKGAQAFSAGMNFLGNRDLTLGIFFLTFAQFFPAVTGIDAGIGMSGDLKNPKKSLVKGTFWAIGITFVVYVSIAVIFSMLSKDVLIHSYQNGVPIPVLLTDIINYSDKFPSNILGIMLILGILFATGSSALSVFMTAPRTLQSLSLNDVLPKRMNFFAKDFVENGSEPRYAVILSGAIGFLVIWAGNINTASMIVGILFLVVYGWINGSAFLERVSGNPGFRPTSKNHWSISLYGFTVCIVSIILFDPFIGLLIMASQFAVFKLILKYKAQNRIEGVWWGILFSTATKSLKALKYVVQGSKNWRPVVTAVSGPDDSANPERIAYFASFLEKHKSLVHLNVFGYNKTFEAYGIPTEVIEYSNLNKAISTVLFTSHPGGLEVHTVLIEYMKKLDSLKLFEKLMEKKKNILMLANSSKLNKLNRIDIWWRGESNGNLMVLLAHIITLNSEASIKIIRMIENSETVEQSRAEMQTLLDNSRLSGHVVIIEKEEVDILEILRKYSADSDLIMMGLPGKFSKDSGVRLFGLNELFFDKQIARYEDLPPVLFVKSAQYIELIEQ